MTRSWLALFVALVTVTPLAPVRATSGGARIQTTVTDSQRRPVAGLTVKDFEVREDGQVQKLDGVEPRKPEPRRLAILLDEFHVSAADTVRVRDTIDQFLDRQLRPDDAAMVFKPLDPLASIDFITDRAPLKKAVDGFEGRKGNYEPRSMLEEETLGRAPTLVEAGRAQVVLSALRALAVRLGSQPGRAAILLVSDGFAVPGRRIATRGLPSADIVGRFANRYDVPIYAFDAASPATDSEATDETTLQKLAAETGGTLTRGEDFAGGLARAAAELDAGYTITYQPAHGDDGQFHAVQVTVVQRAPTRKQPKPITTDAEARARAGYISSPSPETLAIREAALKAPILTSRALKRSSLIDVWDGVTRATSTSGRVVVTWEPGKTFGGTAKSSAARVMLRATTKDGAVLYEGTLMPVRNAEASAPANCTGPTGADLCGGVETDRAQFDAPSGRVQLDMTILGTAGQKLDIDARDLDVPALTGSTTVLLPPLVIGTQSAREFRDIAADADAAPNPSREFRRTERLVIRVPAYTSGAPAHVEAHLLNRTGQRMLTLSTLPGAGNGVTQFDLPLAPLAPGEYFLQFSIPGPQKPVEQRVSFRITG